jgi:hypothetical protein
MCKKLIYLVSFVLVLSLAGRASADLVAYWPLDNDANDAIGELNWTLDPNGTSFSTDSILGTGALSFDGITGEGRQDAVGPLIDAFTTKTVVLWFKADSTSGTQALYDEGGSTNGLAIRINEGTLQSAVLDASAQYTVTTPFDSTDWTEVAVSYDHGLLALWVDGAEKATVMADFENQEVSSHSNNATIGATNQDGFGNNADDPIDHFAGLMDDIRLYDHAFPVRIATLPTLADGALQSSTPVDLGWTPGVHATSHDLYLSDSLDDVDAGTEGTLLASLGQAAVGVSVGNLLAETTYYWRVDEVNDADPNSPWKGQVWSFTLAPQTASGPSPIDGAMFVNPATTLSWAPGLNAESHTVYIGENFDDVNNAADGTPQSEPNYTPEAPLETGKVYYWRVDESDGKATYKGDIWSFETPPFIEISDPNLVGWWKLDGEYLDLGYVVDYSGYNLHGTLQGDPQLVEGHDGGALEFDGSDDYVSIDGYKGILGPNPFSITAWINTSDIEGTIMGWGSTAGGATRLEFRIDAHRLRCESSGNVQGDTTLPDGEWIHVAVTVKAGAIIDDPDVTLYLNGQVDNRTSTGGTAALNMDAGYDVIIARRHTSGRFLNALIDDVRLYDKELTDLDVKVISGFLESSNPDPADGAKIVDTFAILGWTPGPFGAEFDVYFGTNPEPGADELVGRVSDPTHFATGLVEGQTYYWRVDDVEADGTTIHTGDVWSFWIPPRGAYNPQPADGQAVTDIDTDLSWSADWNPVMYGVYIESEADEIATATGAPPVMETTFDPGSLEPGTTYYWRVDVFYGTWITGPIWSFTVAAPE